MKQYVRYFKWYFMAVAVLAAVYGGILYGGSRQND